MKAYRRFIRINNDLITSPRFAKRKDADAWYDEMRRKKQFLRDGVPMPDAHGGVLFIEFARWWIKNRMENYPQATWSSDEQRLRDYVLPIISEIPIADITSTQIRGLLLKISEPGFIEKKNDKTFTISPGTRTRVKALLSVMFSDALNEDPPLVRFNPVLGLKIKDKRRGNKKPRVLGDKDTCIDFIANAKKISPLHFTIVCLDLMSGLRKQELIALKWRSVDFKNRILIITEKYEQASGEIKAGTKGGENTSRVIPIPMLLVDILKAHKKDSDHTGPDSFVFSNPNGTFLGPKKIWEIVHDVAVASKIDISTHGLRHTFGREFALNTGNLKALQAILGHSSSQTTDIYSDLANSRIRGFGESVTFDIGVKSSDE